MAQAPGGQRHHHALIGSSCPSLPGRKAPEEGLQLPVLPSRPACTGCDLHKTARHVGTPAIRLPDSLPPTPTNPVVIMLGRNPGRMENEANEPFVGKSGNVLRNGYCGGPTPLKALATIYLFNTVRCFTPADAEPNWGKHTKPCFPHTLTDIEEVLRCHSRPCESRGIGPLPLSIDSPPIASIEPAGSVDSQNSSSSISLIPTAQTPTRPSAVVCLGGMAGQAFVHLGLGETRPKSLAESLRNNGRLVEWRGWPLFLCHTYHPSAYLRNRNHGPAIECHIQMLVDWLQDKLVAPSSPNIVPPRGPR